MENGMNQPWRNPSCGREWAKLSHHHLSTFLTSIIHAWAERLDVTYPCTVQHTVVISLLISSGNRLSRTVLCGAQLHVGFLLNIPPSFGRGRLQSAAEDCHGSRDGEDRLLNTSPASSFHVKIAHSRSRFIVAWPMKGFVSWERMGSAFCSLPPMYHKQKTWVCVRKWANKHSFMGWKLLWT